MRKLQITIMIISLLALAAMVNAQTKRQREIYTALAYGEGIFEMDLWLASAAEQTDRTTATWVANDLGGLAYVEYLHFEEEYTSRSLERHFDDRWFDVTFENYEDWEETERCTQDDMTLIYLDMVNEIDGTEYEYKMRYWILPETSTRVAALSLVLPEDDSSNLEKYAAKLVPDFSEC